MNTFQLLKSGTSFNKQKIQKVEQIFTTKEPVKRSKSQLNDSDDELVQFDAQLAELKESKPKDLAKFNEQVTQLVNKKRDTLNQLRKKYKIKVDGECP